MRFAWLQKNDLIYDVAPPSSIDRLLLMIYNVVWWVPIVLPLAGVIDYEAGFVLFTIVTMGRLVANLYRNNILPPAQGLYFPFRTP